MIRTMMKFLVVDCGTSICRAATVSEEGEILSHSSTPMSVCLMPPAAAEADTEFLWAAVKKVVRAETERYGANGFSAVGVSGMLGYVFLDEHDRPVMPAVIWMDNRASVEADELVAAMGAERIHAITGRRVTPELLAPKLLWFRKHAPKILKRIRRIIGLKDEVVRRLTGVVGTDVTHLNYTLAYNVYESCLDRDILAAVGADERLFPAPRSAVDVAGRVHDAAARETGLAPGTPVAAGSTDGTTAMYGGGVLTRGTGVLVSGTTDVLMMRSDGPVRDASGVLSVNNGVLPGTFLAGGAMGLSGGTIRRLEELLSVPFAGLLEKIAAVEPGAGGLLFIPGLTGERSPSWANHVKGSIAGLSLEHGPEHLYRAALEGMNWRVTELLRVLADNGMVPVEMNTVGGLSTFDEVNRIRADMTGLTWVRPRVTEATCLGTAMFCRVAVDPGVSLEQVTEEWLKPEATFRPDPKAVDRYRSLKDRYRRYFEAIEPSFRAPAGD